MNCHICHRSDGDTFPHEHCHMPHPNGRWIVVNQHGEWRGGPYLHEGRAIERATEYASFNPGSSFRAVLRPDAENYPAPCPQCGSPDQVIVYGRDGSVVLCGCSYSTNPPEPPPVVRRRRQALEPLFSPDELSRVYSVIQKHLGYTDDAQRIKLAVKAWAAFEAVLSQASLSEMAYYYEPGVYLMRSNYVRGTDGFDLQELEDREWQNESLADLVIHVSAEIESAEKKEAEAV